MNTARTSPPGRWGGLFRAAGFEILRLTRAYDDQYLLLEARLVAGGGAQPHPLEEDVATLERSVGHFKAVFDEVVDRGVPGSQRSPAPVAGSSSGAPAPRAWRSSPRSATRRGRSTSRSTSTPTSTASTLAGTGHRIVGPEYLRDHPPALVIIMNPVYREEITADLRRLGVTAAVEAL